MAHVTNPKRFHNLPSLAVKHEITNVKEYIIPSTIIILRQNYSNHLTPHKSLIIKRMCLTNRLGVATDRNGH